MSKSAAEREFRAYAAKLLANPDVQRMDTYIQHGTTTTLNHTERVARASLNLAHALHLDVCEVDLVAGALLHDFYLYDWHDRTTSKPNHATKHPLYAAENARELLGVSESVASIIETHMWPLPLSRVPKSKEAWIVCATDKWCSLVETIGDRVQALRGENSMAGGNAASAASAAESLKAGERHVE